MGLFAMLLQPARVRVADRVADRAASCEVRFVFMVVLWKCAADSGLEHWDQLPIVPDGTFRLIAPSDEKSRRLITHELRGELPKIDAAPKSV